MSETDRSGASGAARRGERHRAGFCTPAVLLSAVLMSGCVDYRVREYAPIVMALDDRNELHISTYPSWFPRETSDIPFLKKTVRTPESVYFQVHVRAIGTQAGPNPHVDSILIRSLSYQTAGQAPVLLVENHDASFWMQDQPAGSAAKRAPVPWAEGQRLSIAISLVLNGRPYELTNEMRAVERQRTGSLLSRTFLQ